MAAAPVATAPTPPPEPSGSRPTVAAGTLLSNRYRLVREIGRGGFGVVWLAEDTRLERRPVAIKLLDMGLIHDEGAIEAFRNEAVIALSLTHERIVRLHIFDVDGALNFLVFELLAGPTLAQILRRRGQLSLPEMVLVADQVCDALWHAHRNGVVHCDIKPSNIMLAEPLDDISHTALMEPKCSFKLTDFGIAQPLREALSRSQQAPVAGTPSYMSPEVLTGRPPTTASDIYSLGCVLYAALAGHPPFQGEDVVQQQISAPPPPIPGVSPAVNAVILRCLAKGREARWAEAPELANALHLAVERNEAPQVAAIDTTMSSAIDLAEPDENFESEDAFDLPEEYISPNGGLYSLIPGGVFKMGTPADDSYRGAGEWSAHDVLLNTFYLGKWPVTVAEYSEFLKLTGHREPHRWSDQRVQMSRPVVYVSWDDAAAFCTWLSRASGQHFRLPTEAEWECAARGGLEGARYPWGNEDVDGRAVHNSDERRDGSDWAIVNRHLPEVGQFPPNGFNVHDMAGLVAEWCHDFYSEELSEETPRRNPRGPAKGLHRVLRGGSWLLPATYLRCSARHRIGAGTRCPDYGFRVVRAIPR
jgi:formylglycine-generating enzyme required for sulfatase activity